MKKSTLVKLLALILCAMMVLPLFAACNEVEIDTGDSGSESESVTESATESGAEETESTEGSDESESAEQSEVTDPEGSETTEPGEITTTEPGEITTTEPGEITTTEPGEITTTEPAETDPAETDPAETDPAETDPAETDPAETDPAETDPAETDPEETDPAETDPAETDPAETDPADTDPAETDPAETDPAETDPAETDPAETDPAETDPAETDPAETDPAETDPEETDPAETDPEDTEPVCDGNHELVADGVNGHYEAACEICGTAAGQTVLHTYSDDEAYKCECGYDPDCGGVHEYDTDKSEHSRAACAECGEGEVAKTAHTYSDDEAYKCECGYDPECNGVHKYTDDGENGHSRKACAECGFAADAQSAAHEYEKSVCVECGHACHATHSWTKDKYKHSLASACEVCDQAEVAQEAHEFKTVADDADARGYRLVCECGAELDVNAYFTDGGVWNSSKDNCKGNIQKGLYDEDEGLYYNRYTVESGQSFFDLVTSNPGNTSGGYTADVKAGKYVALMVRGKFINDRKFYIGTENNSDGQDNPEKTSIGTLSKAALSETEWMVIVVDLSQCDTDFYTIGETAGITFSTQETYPGDVLDVAFVAFADDIADLRALMSTATYADYGMSLNNMPATRNVTDGACAGHVRVKVADSTDPRGYKIGCPCGEADLKIDALFTDGSIWKSEYHNGNIEKGLKDGDVTYNRYTVVSTDEASNEVTYFDLVYASSTGVPGDYTEEVKAGRYMAIKLRGKLNDGRILKIGTEDKSDGSGNPETVSIGMLDKNILSETAWKVIVVDLGECANYTVDAVTGISLHTAEMCPGDVLDVAFVAFADRISDLKDVIDTDEYLDFGTSLSNAPVTRITETDECAGHNYAYTVVETSVDARGYRYQCGCGAALTVNGYFVEGGGFTVAAEGDSKAVKEYDQDGGFYYYHHSVTRGTGYFDLVTSITDTKHGNFTDVSIKTGRYIAIKLRGTFAGNHSFYVGSKDKHPAGSETPKTESMGLLGAETLPSEWTVVIVDLSQLSTYYTVGVKDKVALQIKWLGTGETLDVAYVAFADTVESLMEVVSDDKYTMYGTSLSNTGIVVDKATGEHEGVECVVGVHEVIDSEIEGYVKYQNTCFACGKVYWSKEIPETVAHYKTPYAVLSDLETGNSFASVKTEGGVTFTEFKGGTSQTEAIYTRNHSDSRNPSANGWGSEQMGTPIDVGASKYLVMKVKLTTQALAESFAIEMSTTGVNAVAGSTNGFIRLKPFEDITVNEASPEWVTVVIDLSKCCNDETDKYYAADPTETSKYILDTFKFNARSGNLNISVAYIAFAESWADIDGIVDETTVFFAESNLAVADGASAEAGKNSTGIYDSVPEYDSVTVDDKVAAEAAQ